MNLIILHGITLLVCTNTQVDYQLMAYSRCQAVAHYGTLDECEEHNNTSDPAVELALQFHSAGSWTMCNISPNSQKKHSI